ncbi:MAG: hypothetical protein H7A51_04490 [Akkermansiaceae bacterium]|nr:hypothetical protein [Akkermansiaceae bacterium]
MNTQRREPQTCPCRSKKYGQRGFALIATVSVMSLLILIALAMLSLTTIEVRQAQNSNDQAIQPRQMPAWP